jgi:hypothetical protein
MTWIESVAITAGAQNMAQVGPEKLFSYAKAVGIKIRTRSSKLKKY